MLKPFSMIFFIAVMVWIGGIFVTSDPRARIDRACLPVTFADSLLVAVVQVIHEPYAMGAHEMMLSIEYGCKFTVWKSFYEERNKTGAAEKSETITPKKSQANPVRSSEQQNPVTLPNKAQSEPKEALTEVNVTSKPLPVYLENK